LAVITVNSANLNFSSADGVLFNKSQTSLFQCPGAKAGLYTIPSSVTMIKDRAFFLCVELRNVVIPDSVTSIGNLAFNGCYSLTNITIPNSVISIGDFAFDYLQFPNVSIGNSVISIGYGAFLGNHKLARITIPSSVTSIGDSAFADCENLYRVNFLGNAPLAGNLFLDGSPSTVYYLPGTTGWEPTFSGRPTAVAISFIQQPANVSVNQGRSAAFGVATSGSGVTYQWQKGGTDIPNATAATLTLSDVQATHAGNYTVVISNLEGNVTSNVATLTVFPDADGDGLTDAQEAAYGTNPNSSDTDGDGLDDDFEVNTSHSSPTLKDSDGDGYEDGFEITTGFSPTSASSTPQAVSMIHPAVEFQFSADNGVGYQIQESTDLQNWSTIESNIIGQGRVESRFYSIQNQAKRYFRVSRN
jgi:hypothetical protein